MSRKDRRGTLAPKAKSLNANSNKDKSRKIPKAKSKTAKKPKQVSIFTLLFGIILIVFFIGIYLGARWLILTLKYKETTDKMNWYGYNDLYDNGKANSTQKVTNSELLKVVLGVLSNNKDIYNLYYLANKENSEATNWYYYSKYLGVNNVIEKKDLDKNATTLDAVMLMVETLDAIVKIDLEATPLNMNVQKLNRYTKEEQEIIAKAVTLGVIPNKTSALSNKQIVKGQLNELVISVAEKYVTMHHSTNFVDDNGNVVKENVKLVTQKEKLPHNYEQYPYILDNIEKEVYEFEYDILTESTAKTPKETYRQMGYLYGQISELITRYFNKILNVDYETITESNFLASITNDVAYLLSEEDVKAYVDYVKENKIKLQGSAIPLLPIMYNNGEQYFVRTKLTFKVLNANAKYNLLFGDENNMVHYDSEEITMYVDVPMGMTINSNSLLVSVACLAKHMPNQNSLIVLEK